MLTRRRFLERTLKGSSLVALGPTVPGFLAATARAAEPGKDTILVVVEMTGGNDGLNTVVPYADDLYHAARPTLRLTHEQVVRVDDHVGLNPGLRGLEKLLSDGQLAIVQGVGYPNPDRSHFESMDVWQTADPARKIGSGWLGRGLGSVRVAGRPDPRRSTWGRSSSRWPCGARRRGADDPPDASRTTSTSPCSPDRPATPAANPPNRRCPDRPARGRPAPPDRGPRRALARPRRPRPVRPPDLAPDLRDDRGTAQGHQRRRPALGSIETPGAARRAWARTWTWWAR